LGRKKVNGGKKFIPSNQ